MVIRAFSITNTVNGGIFRVGYNFIQIPILIHSLSSYLGHGANLT